MADAILSELFPSRVSSLKSIPFVLAVLFFSIALLRFTFYLAEITPAVNFHFNDSSTTDRIGQTLSFTLAGGIIAGLLCGTVIDKLRAAFHGKISRILSMKRSPDMAQALLWMKLRPMGFSMLIMATFSTIVSCLVFVPNEYVYYVNFVFLVLMRGFLFSTFSSSIMAAFPIAQFGTLYGIGGSLAGAFSCIQYVLLLPIPPIGNGIALGLLVFLFVPPFFILIKSSLCYKKLIKISDLTD